MPQVYGIDFGTCSSSISLGGNVLCNKDGCLTTPTKVLLNCDKDSKSVVVVYFKRLIGLSFSHFTQNTQLVAFFKQFGPDFHITLLPDTIDELAFFVPSASRQKYYSLHDITTAFLKSFLHDIPSLNWNDDSSISAVITVPANFGPLQRNFVQHAFESVGVNVVKILNEPTAALYAHSLNSLTTPTCVLVLDCGGGTTDISVIDVNNNVFNVLHTWGDPFLGGNDLTQYLVEYLCDSKYNLCKSEKLYKNCETAKHQLSSSFSANISLGSSYVSISRAKFEDITTPFWNSIKDVLHQFYHIYNYSRVILVGGSTKTPRFTDLIKNITNVSILRLPNPTYTVCIGASLYAETLFSKTSDNILIDILGYNLGVELHGGVMCPIITKLSSLPVSKSKEFSNSAEDSDSNSDKNTIKINVYAGERYLVKDNHFITTLTLSYPDDSKELFSAGNLRILVTFSVDTNGLLSVTACDKTCKSITVSASSAIFSPSSGSALYKNDDKEDGLDDDMDMKMLDAQLMRAHTNSH